MLLTTKIKLKSFYFPVFLSKLGLKENTKITMTRKLYKGNYVNIIMFWYITLAQRHGWLTFCMSWGDCMRSPRDPGAGEEFSDIMRRGELISSTERLLRLVLWWWTGAGLSLTEPDISHNDPSIQRHWIKCLSLVNSMETKNCLLQQRLATICKFKTDLQVNWSSVLN